MRTRQKVLLSLLLRSPGQPTRTQLIKWLFLLRQEGPLASDPTFHDFLPYHYGPFSFEAYNDVDALRRGGFLDGATLRVPTVRIAEVRALEARLPEGLRQAIAASMDRYVAMSDRELCADVYARYPWYATRSRLRCGQRNPPRARPAVYTAGYQERSLDKFLDILLRAGVTMLIDVRSNPLSRKYGFSRAALHHLSAKVGIEYRHYPDLGIDGALRRDVSSIAQHQELLDYYERAILPRRQSSIARVAKLIEARPCALVCYEADPRDCHRGRLAGRLAEVTGLAPVHL